MVGVGLREARAALESFRGKNVLVIGDAMLDEYYIGPTARLAPEAPVPLIAIQEHSYDLGGAANVAKNVRALGGQARLAAVVGLDQPGLELRALLGRKGIDAEGVETDGGRITTVKTRVKTDGLLIVRYDRETAEPIDGVIEERLLLFLRQAIPKTDAITISDYSKGVLTPAVVARINELAKQHNVPIIADSKQLGKLGIKNINILKQNWRQASIETGIELDPS
ncbi:MAG TPA: PfkB family carbohydrate kinase, partial [Candidatus Norongarragalinales archaeon]|nr:PfkB family carbohydrate kinase [Candidatus Norongarragalinales archaeon]